MPLLGSYGGSSEYAYRGTIDDFPNDFTFVNQVDATPGQLLTSNQVTITGINNRALVRVSAGASVSVNGGSYVIPTEASPVFIRNNQTLSVRIPSTSGRESDFDKSYTALVSVGKKSTTWEAKTKKIDDSPTAFGFTNLTNREIGVGYTSNEITISGLEPGFSFPAEITSTDGQLVRNNAAGLPFGESVNVVNGDKIKLLLQSSPEYSTTVSTSIRVGTYSTSWSVSTRPVDIFIDPFDFPDIKNANIDSVFEVLSINPTTGINTNITGADENIDLVTAVTGCDLQVERFDNSVRKPYSFAIPTTNPPPTNTLVRNRDRLRVRIKTGTEYSKTVVGIVTVSNFTGRFIVTTRPRPIDTIPDRFSFNDVTVSRGATVESNEITLTGITTGDQGTASLSTVVDGGSPAEFKVTRGTQVVRNYGIGTALVQNNDKITLKIVASPNSNISRKATFRVDGIDTFLIPEGGTSAFQSDEWNVTSEVRNCGITPFTIPSVTNAAKSTIQTTTFTVSGFATDCGTTVSTSAGTLSVTGSSLTNNIPVTPGAQVTLRLTSSPNFSGITTATVTVSNSLSGIPQVGTYVTTWTVKTVDDTTPSSVTLTASPTSVIVGSNTRLTWSSVNATEVISTSGFDASGRLSGFVDINQTTAGTKNYSITVRANPSASNSGTTPTPSSSTTVTVSNDTTPDSFNISPSSLTNRQKGQKETFTAQSSANNSVSVTGLTAGVTVNASIFGSASGLSVKRSGSSFFEPEVTSAEVGNNDTIRVFLTNGTTDGVTVTGGLNIGDVSKTFSTTTVSCNPDASNFSKEIVPGVSVTYKPANVDGIGLNLYVSKSGGTTVARFGTTTSGTKKFTTSPFTVPDGVTSIQFALVGGGGGGGTSRGGGAGAVVTGVIPTSGGQSVAVERAAAGGTNGNPSRIKVNNLVVAEAKGGLSGDSNGTGGTGSGPTGSAINPGNPSSGQTGGSTSPGGQAGRPASGGGGGTGGGLTLSEDPNGGISLNPNSGQPGSSAGGAITGFQGNNGGGSGAGTNKASSGTGGAAVFYQSTGSSTSNISWDEVINQIVTSISSKANRAPTDTEIAKYAKQFTDSTTLSLSQLDTNIRNDTAITRATTVLNICGNPF